MDTIEHTRSASSVMQTQERNDTNATAYNLHGVRLILMLSLCIVMWPAMLWAHLQHDI